MSRVNLSLSSKRKTQCENAIFPADYYDIPGLQGYEDLDAVRSCALSSLRQYENNAVNIYVNGGLAIETLTAIQVARMLNIDLNLFQWNRRTGEYLEQKVLWKPGVGMHKDEESEDFSLCDKRHYGMKGKFLYPDILQDQLFDFDWQMEHVKKILMQYQCGAIRLYLSGFTPAYVSVLNAAYEFKIAVVAMHYNCDTENYFPQDMENCKRGIYDRAN